MSRLPKKTLFKSTTSLSINERFTRLRGIDDRDAIRQARTATNRENNSALRQASIKNRRLAQQMERRPTVMAALKIKKKSIRQRLGPFENKSSLQSRLQLPGTSGVGVHRIGGTLRGRGLGSRLTRGRFLTRGRSSVVVSPRGIRRTSFLPTSTRGNLRGALIRRQTVLQRLAPRSLDTNQFGRRPISTEIHTNRPAGNGQFRSGTRGIRLRGSRFQGSGINRSQFRGSEVRRGQVRGRGFRGGRGGFFQQNRGQQQRYSGGYNQRGRGRGDQQRYFRGGQRRNQRVPFRGFRRDRYESKPSKEELDDELDRYMSNTQTSRHDHQLDSYMRRDSSNSWH